MGFLSKLLGNNKSGEEALNFLKDAAREVMNEATAKRDAQQSQPAKPSYAPAAAASPRSGFSWGDEMPAEENQFSFPGNYVQYFEKIFREEFPACRVDVQAENSSRYTVFTFWDNGRQALIVEVRSEKCCAEKLRRVCAANGVPYLRFYFDHHGWWNTRAYVTERVRRALIG